MFSKNTMLVRKKASLEFRINSRCRYHYNYNYEKMFHFKKRLDRGGKKLFKKFNCNLYFTEKVIEPSIKCHLLKNLLIKSRFSLENKSYLNLIVFELINSSLNDLSNNTILTAVNENHLKTKIVLLKTYVSKKYLSKKLNFGNKMICSSFYNTFDKKYLLISIIGSIGKTTSATLITHIFKKIYVKFSSMTSLKYELNDLKIYPNTSMKQLKINKNNATLNLENKYQITYSNPHFLQLFRLFSSVQIRGCQIILLEIENNDIINRNSKLFVSDILLVTNIYQKENFFLKNFVKSIARLAFYINTLYVLNREDSFCENIIYVTLTNKFFSYSLSSKQADIFSETIIYSIWGTEAIINTKLGLFTVDTKLIGKHSVYNILSSISIGISLNIPIIYIDNATESIEQVRGRTELIDFGQTFSVVLDYAETPEVLDLLLTSLISCCPTSILIICGGNGSFSTNDNSKIGAKCLQFSKKLFITNNNPKWIDPNDIITEIISSFPKSIKFLHGGAVYDWLLDIKRVPIWFESWLFSYQNQLNCYIIESRSLAIKSSLAMSAIENLVLITGRGNKKYQYFLNTEGNITKIKSNDFEECLEALKKIYFIYDMNLKTEKMPWSIKP